MMNSLSKTILGIARSKKRYLFSPHQTYADLVNVEIDVCIPQGRQYARQTEVQEYGHHRRG